MIDWGGEQPVPYFGNTTPGKKFLKAMRFEGER